MFGGRQVSEFGPWEVSLSRSGVRAVCLSGWGESLCLGWGVSVFGSGGVALLGKKGVWDAYVTIELKKVEGRSQSASESPPMFFLT